MRGYCKSVGIDKVGISVSVPQQIIFAYPFHILLQVQKCISPSVRFNLENSRAAAGVFHYPFVQQNFGQQKTEGFSSAFGFLLYEFL